MVVKKGLSFTIFRVDYYAPTQVSFFLHRLSFTKLFEKSLILSLTVRLLKNIHESHPIVCVFPCSDFMLTQPLIHIHLGKQSNQEIKMAAKQKKQDKISERNPSNL